MACSDAMLGGKQGDGARRDLQASSVRLVLQGGASPWGWVSITEHLPLLLRPELCASLASG